MRLPVVTLTLAVAAPIGIVLAATPSPAGDPAAGQRAFATCAGCHSVQPNKNGIGPSLAGVAGRDAGSAPGYQYSPGMAHAQFTWDAAHLDEFLAHPQSVVHGTKMYAAVPIAQQRGDIIAYLNSLK
jgi:cytochrome c2